MRKAAIFFAMMGVLLAGPAKADWIFTTDENPFEGDLHLAVNVDGFGTDAAAFRCRVGEKRHLDLMLATPDHIPQDILAKVSDLIVKIAVIVDDQPQDEVIAWLDINDRKDNTLRATSQDPDLYGIAQKVAAAQRRAAFAILVSDKIVYQHVYDVGGSTRAVGKIVEDCKETKETLNGFRPRQKPASAQKSATDGARVITYENVTAQDWGHLPLSAVGGIAMKAERLYNAERRAGRITGPRITDGFEKP